MNATEMKSHLGQVLAADDGERHAAHVMQQNGCCGAPFVYETPVQAFMKMGYCAGGAQKLHRLWSPWPTTWWCPSVAPMTTQRAASPLAVA